MTEGVEVYVFSLLHPKENCTLRRFLPLFLRDDNPPKTPNQKKTLGSFFGCFLPLVKAGIVSVEILVVQVVPDHPHTFPVLTKSKRCGEALDT